MPSLPNFRFPIYRGLTEEEKSSFSSLPFLMHALKREIERQEIAYCVISDHFKRRLAERTKMTLEEFMHLFRTQSCTGIALLNTTTTCRVIFSEKDDMLFYVPVRVQSGKPPLLLTIIPAYTIEKKIDDDGCTRLQLRTSYFRLPKSSVAQRKIKKIAKKMDNLLRPPESLEEQINVSKKKTKPFHLTVDHIVTAFRRLERPFPEELLVALKNFLKYKKKTDEEILDILYPKARYKHCFNLLMNDGCPIEFHVYTKKEENALHFPKPLLRDYLCFFVKHVVHRPPEHIDSANIEVFECVPNDNGWVDCLGGSKRSIHFDANEFKGG